MQTNKKNITSTCTYTEDKYDRADLGEMAGHSLAGTQRQAVLCHHGQVVQQAESHRGDVQLVGHAVLQLLSAAGELAGREETAPSFMKPRGEIKRLR